MCLFHIYLKQRLCWGGRNEAPASRVSTRVYVNGGTRNLTPVFLSVEEGPPSPPPSSSSLQCLLLFYLFFLIYFFANSISSKKKKKGFKIATCDHSKIQPRNRNSEAGRTGGGSESDHILPHPPTPPPKTQTLFLSNSSQVERNTFAPLLASCPAGGLSAT